MIDAFALVVLGLTGSLLLSTTINSYKQKYSRGVTIFAALATLAYYFSLWVILF